MRLYHQRTQWAVGQGFFHTGAFYFGKEAGTHNSYKNADIVYVYDCGTKINKYSNQLSREIHHAKDKLNGRNIDILFISHLHEDHIAGLGQLLDGTTRVKLVVMPHFDNDTLAFSLGKTLFETGSESPVTSQYIGFISGIVAFLSHKADKILMIGGAGGGDDIPPPLPDALHPVPNEPPAGYELLFPADTQAETAAGPHIHYGNLFGKRSTKGQNWYNTSKSQPLYIVSSYEELKPFWEFLTYKSKSTGDISQFSVLVKAQLGSGLSLASLTENRSQQQNVLSVLRDSYKASAGEKESDDLNRTSVSLYSGLLPKAKLSTSNIINCIQCRSKSEKCDTICEQPDIVHDDAPQKLGWLGTGDSELMEDNDFKPFIKYYNVISGNVLTMTLPHHGSKKNFHETLTDSLRPYFALAPADRYPRYGHPAAEVLQKAEESGARSVMVSSREWSRFHEFIDFELP